MFVFVTTDRLLTMALQDDIQIYDKRRILYVVIALILLIFLGRLYQLQMFYSEEFGKKSEENSIRVIPREPIRGNMYDRNTRARGRQPSLIHRHGHAV